MIGIVGMYSNIEVLKKLKSSARNHAAAIKSMYSNTIRFRFQNQNSLKSTEIPTPSELKVGLNFFICRINYKLNNQKLDDYPSITPCTYLLLSLHDYAFHPHFTYH